MGVAPCKPLYVVGDGSVAEVDLLVSFFPDAGNVLPSPGWVICTSGSVRAIGRQGCEWEGQMRVQSVTYLITFPHSPLARDEINCTAAASVRGMDLIMAC
jgi:hypothetical protein